ncbi:MAG: prepilin-type N-terminal cleavage/methylation domain-containing protein [Firmicutes bacterium]|nr:prepilin-type N-terminal cleavage/methylation domain-containing protein [Bacillota bacterium]
MSKKGFTLIELLGVLVVLGALALIIIPSVTSTLNNSQEKAYQKLIHTLETAAEKWGIENIDMLPEPDSGEVLEIYFDMLYQSGQITEYPIINPKLNRDLDGCILATYNSQYQQYEYNYSETCNN